jgi:hypothetical protein
VYAGETGIKEMACTRRARFVQKPSQFDEGQELHLQAIAPGLPWAPEGGVNLAFRGRLGQYLGPWFGWADVDLGSFEEPQC